MSQKEKNPKLHDTSNDPDDYLLDSANKELKRQIENPNEPDEEWDGKSE